MKSVRPAALKHVDRGENSASTDFPARFQCTSLSSLTSDLRTVAVRRTERWLLLTTCSPPNVQAVDDKPEDEDEKTVGARLLPPSKHSANTTFAPPRDRQEKSHVTRATCASSSNTFLQTPTPKGYGRDRERTSHDDRVDSRG